MVKVEFQKDSKYKDKYLMLLSNDKQKEKRGVFLEDLSTKSKIEFKITLDGENYMEALDNFIKEQKIKKEDISGIIPKEVLLQYTEDDNIKSDLTYSIGKKSKTFEGEANSIRPALFGNKEFFLFVYKNKNIILDLSTGDTLIVDYMYQKVIKENDNYIYLVVNSGEYNRGGFFIDMSKGFSHLIKDKYMINYLPKENQENNVIKVEDLIGKTLNPEVLNSGLRYYAEDEYLSRSYILIGIFWHKERVLVDDKYKIIDKILSKSELLLKNPFEEDLEELVIEEDKEKIVTKIFYLGGLRGDYQLEFNVSNNVIGFKECKIEKSIEFPYTGTDFLYELKEVENGKYKLGDKIAFILKDNSQITALNLDTKEKNNIKDVKYSYKYVYLTGTPYIITREEDNRGAIIFTYNKILNKIRLYIKEGGLEEAYLRFINIEIVTPNFTILNLAYNLFLKDHQGHKEVKVVIAEGKERSVFEDVKETDYSSLIGVLRIVLKNGIILYFNNGKEQTLKYPLKQGENTIVGYSYGQTPSNKKGILVDKYLIDGKEFEIYFGKDYFEQKMKTKDSNIELPRLAEFEDLSEEKQKKAITYLANLLDKNLKFEKYDLYNYEKLLNLIILKNYKIIFDELRRKKEEVHNYGIGYIDFESLPEKKAKEIKKAIDNIKYYESLLLEDKGGNLGANELYINELLDINKKYIEVEGNPHSYTDDLEGDIECFNDTINRLKNKLETYYIGDYKEIYKRIEVKPLSESDFEI